MDFVIKRSKSIPNYLSKFYFDESSFDMDPPIFLLDYCLVLNKLDLVVINQEVTWMSGYCPFSTWILSDFNPPKHFKGTLILLDRLEPGFSYYIDNNEWPIYFNRNSDWVCIGNPKISEVAVEFLPNIIAVVASNKLISLWIKPKFFEYAQDGLNILK